jgi:hypothetical protein
MLNLVVTSRAYTMAGAQVTTKSRSFQEFHFEFCRLNVFKSPGLFFHSQHRESLSGVGDSVINCASASLYQQLVVILEVF